MRWYMKPSLSILRAEEALARINRTHKSQNRTCYECNCELPTSELKKHLIEKHNYKSIHGHVFKPGICRYCNKPGIYIVNGIQYCSAHKTEAVKAAKNSARKVDANSTPRDKFFEERSRMQRRVDKSRVYGKELKGKGRRQ